eukprot:1178210-Amphidinium_carterae.1
MEQAWTFLGEFGNPVGLSYILKLKNQHFTFGKQIDLQPHVLHGASWHFGPNFRAAATQCTAQRRNTQSRKRDPKGVPARPALLPSDKNKGQGFPKRTFNGSKRKPQDCHRPPDQDLQRLSPTRKTESPT